MKKFLNANPFAVERNKAWFTLNDLSLLCEFDFNTGQSRVLVDLQMKEGTCFCCAKDGDYVYCFSDWSDEIFRYDLKNAELKSIIIPDSHTMGIFDVFFEDDVIFVYAGRRGKIYEIDKKKLELIETYFLYDVENATAMRAVKMGRRIITATNMLGCLAIFDIDKRKVELIVVKEISDVVVHVFAMDSYIYVSGGNSGFLHKCKFEDEKIIYKKSIKFSDLQWDDSYPPIDTIIERNDNLWIVSRVNNEILFINPVNNEIENVAISKERFWKNNEKIIPWYSLKFTYLYYRENRFLGILIQDKCLVVELDLETREYKFIDSEINHEKILNYYSKKDFFVESNYMDLQKFVKVISNKIKNTR